MILLKHLIFNKFKINISDNYKMLQISICVLAAMLSGCSVNTKTKMLQDKKKNYAYILK